MKLQILKRDVKVFYVEAKQFPDGISEAFHTLEDLHPSVCERPFYGISNEDRNRNIVYWAAVEESYKGEGARYGCKTFVISSGTYLTETIVDFMNNIHSIPKAFNTLLSDPRRDRKFPCVEWYKSDKEMMCMIKLKQTRDLN